MLAEHESARVKHRGSLMALCALLFAARPAPADEVCGFTIAPGARLEACQVGIGSLDGALFAASVPLFVLGVRGGRNLDRVTLTTGTRGGAVGWTF